jgi:hypothetical protein
VTPADGQRLAFPFPHFQWDCGSGAEGLAADWRFQLAADPVFATLLEQDTIAGVACRYYRTEPLPPGLYFWRAFMGPAPDTITHNFTLLPVDHTVQIPVGATFEEIAALVQTAAALPGSKLVQFALAPGREYRLHPPPTAPGIDAILFNLTNAQDLILDGQDQLVNFSSPATFIRSVDGQRVLLTRIAFDIFPLPYTALLVTGTSLGGAHPAQATLASGPNATAPMVVTATLAAGHPAPESNPAFLAYGLAELMDTALYRVKRGGPLLVGYTSIQATGPDSYQLLLTSGADTVAVGDAIVIDPRQAVGFSVLGGSQHVWHNVSVFACANECITSQASDTHAVVGFRLLRLPGRFLAANNGGHNHHSMAIAPWIAASVFENSGDDMCHVSGLVMSVARVINSTALLLAQSSPDVYASTVHPGDLKLQLGDTLTFFNHHSGQIVQQAQIVALEPATRDGSLGWLTPVRMSEPLDVANLVPGFIEEANFNDSVRPCRAVQPRACGKACCGWGEGKRETTKERRSTGGGGGGEGNEEPQPLDCNRFLNPFGTAAVGDPSL